MCVASKALSILPPTARIRFPEREIHGSLHDDAILLFVWFT